MIPVKDIKLKEGMDLKSFIDELGKSGGFVAKKVWLAREILNKMINEKNIVKFFSFPACIVSTGTRGVIVEALKRKWFDVIITTTGTLDHDFARLFEDYYHGSFRANDKELREKGIHRLGNIFIPMKNYGENIEKHLIPILEDIGEGEFSTYELIWEIGKRLEKREESIIYWSYKNKIPIIIPGITDGAFGTQLLFFMQDHKLNVNVWKDEEYLLNLMFDIQEKGLKTGALMIGGGISKHHTIWWNQFKEGLDYAVYITTAVEWDGSLSGARMEEAITWNKLKEEAKFVNVEGDATVLLPLIFGALV